MKENFVHVCFVIDESGSMYEKKEDVVGGFKTLLKEQKSKTEGDMAVSLYRFNDTVTEEFLGKNVNEIDTDLTYSPNGMTALFDGVGMAIDNVGKWLDGMKEEDKPSLNIIVVMTDGLENASREYKAEQVKNMIKHQEDKYSWQFMYIGADVNDSTDANIMGFKTKLFSSKDKYLKNYDIINTAVNSYRTGLTAESVASYLSQEAITATAEYNDKTGLNLS